MYLLEMFQIFEVVPSIYPPILYEQIEVNNGKVVQRRFAPMDSIDIRHYKKCELVDTQFPQIICESDG
jgi:hypothetical protein